MIADVVSSIICKIFSRRDQRFCYPLFDQTCQIGVAEVPVDTGIGDPEIEIISILVRSEDQSRLLHSTNMSQIAAAQRSGYIFEGFIEIFDFSHGVTETDHFYNVSRVVVIFRGCHHPDGDSEDQNHRSYGDEDRTVIKFED